MSIDGVKGKLLPRPGRRLLRHWGIQMKPVVAMILAASVAGCLTSADYGAESGPRALVAMVRDQLSRCWNPPAETGVPPVKVRLELNQDGTLARDPVALPVNSGDLQNAQFQPAAKSALRAVRACTPLRLPEVRYDLWKEAEVIFDPRLLTATRAR